MCVIRWYACETIHQADFSERAVLTNRQGKRIGVVLSLKRYSRLMEDLHDLAVVAERGEKPLSADDMKIRPQASLS